MSDDTCSSSERPSDYWQRCVHCRLRRPEMRAATVPCSAPWKPHDLEMGGTGLMEISSCHRLKWIICIWYIRICIINHNIYTSSKWHLISHTLSHTHIHIKSIYIIKLNLDSFGPWKFMLADDSLGLGNPSIDKKLYIIHVLAITTSAGLPG